MSRLRAWNIRNAVKQMDENPDKVALAEVVTVHDEAELSERCKALEQDISDGQMLIASKESEVEAMLNRRSDADSGLEIVEIEAMKRGVEKKKRQLREIKTVLDGLLGAKEQAKRVEDAMRELSVVQEEVALQMEERNKLKATLASLPAQIQQLDWAINNILLPKSARLKDILENLKRQH